MNTIELMEFRNDSTLPKLSKLALSKLKNSTNGVIKLPKKVNKAGICEHWTALYKLQIDNIVKVTITAKTLIISKGINYNTQSI